MNFSVIIPTYNRGNLIVNAINSVLKQSYSAYEVIVVDDGSTDHTKETLTNLGSSIVAIHKPNGGVSSARNAGLEVAKGDYICFLDSDDEWQPNHLEVIAQSIHCNEKIPDFIITDMFRSDSGGTHYDKNSNIFPQIKSGEKIDGTTIKFAPDTFFEIILSGFPFYPSTFCVKNDLFKNIKWNENTRYSEDFIFVCQLSKISSLAYIDNASVKINLHDNNLSSNTTSMLEPIIAQLLKLFRDPSNKPFRTSIANSLLSKWKEKVLISSPLEKVGLISQLAFNHIFWKALYLKSKSKFSEGLGFTYGS